MRASRAFVRSFREQYMQSDPSEQELSEFTSPAARTLRYALLWSAYDNTIYRDIHAFARSHRSTFGLYKYIRSIHSPANRIGEYYATHLHGGSLDIDRERGAGPGGAIPIDTGNNQLRLSIAALWKASKWQANKTLYARFGSVLGDVMIEVVDDPAKAQVYLQVQHPGAYTSIIRDAMGNVKSYQKDEKRADPRATAKDGDQVQYTLKVTRAAENVIYETFLEGKPYAWNNIASTWAEPYGFIPLVAVMHIDVGVGWGASELSAGLTKLREVDDIASKLHDQIRKIVDSPWLFTGVSNDDEMSDPSSDSTTQNNPQNGREEITAFYGPIGADAKALIADLDIAAVSERIERMVAELERDFPELRADISSSSGTGSGRALRVARQAVTTKINERRVSYDAGLIAAMQMAIAIGGWRGYPGYDGFSLDSYAAGDLEMSIPERPVYAPDPLDDIEIFAAFWDGAQKAKSAGGDEAFFMYLEDNGWDVTRIARLRSAIEKQAREMQAQMQQAPIAQPPNAAQQVEQQEPPAAADDQPPPEPV